MEVMQDHQHGGQDTALVQGTPITSLSFSATPLAIRMLAGFSQGDHREVTKGHVWPRAVVQE